MPTISSQSTLVGVALMALGVLFLLPVVTGIELSIGKWWPLIIMLGGMFAFSRGAPWHGLTAIGIAAFLLLSNLDIVNVDIWQFWPVLLLVAGASILFGHARRARPQEGFTSETSDDLNLACFFSGSEQRIDSQTFRGGRVTAMFGGADIDLRSAAIADGAATIDVSAVFGGVEIRVPDNWAVNVQASTTFGGVETKRSGPADPKAKLTITGSCLFGGIEIRS